MREKAGAQRRLLSAKEEEAGRADAPYPTQPLYVEESELWVN